MAMNSDVYSFPDLNGLEVLRARSSDHRFPVHCHSTFVIEQVTRGADWCCLNDLTAEKGDVMVHAPSTAHTGGPIANASLEYFAIYPSSEMFDDFADADSEVLLGKTFVCKDRSVKRLMRELSNCINQSRLVSQFESVLKRLLHQLVSSTEQPALCNDSDPLDQIDQAKKFLEQNCRQEISIVALAERFGLSQFHFIRKFKKIVGITPRQYLICRRVAMGKELIANGQSIISAALDCGFSDQSHFTRCFKRVTGYSPGIFAGSFE